MWLEQNPRCNKVFFIHIKTMSRKIQLVLTNFDDPLRLILFTLIIHKEYFTDIILICTLSTTKTQLCTREACFSTLASSCAPFFTCTRNKFSAAL